VVVGGILGSVVVDEKEVEDEDEVLGSCASHLGQHVEVDCLIWCFGG